MKIAIINAPFTVKNTPKTLLKSVAQGFPSDIMCSSLLSYLSSSIKNSHQVKVFDANLKDYKKKKVKKFDPDVILFLITELMPSPSLSWTYKTSKELKKELNSKIIFGGEKIDLMARTALKTTVADYVLIGEADYTFPKLIDYLDGKGKLPKKGIGFKKDGKPVVTEPTIVKDLDKLPLPDRSLFDLEKYQNIAIETSRGCIRKCDFCYLSAIEKSWRARSAESLKKEIDYLSSNFEMGDKRLFLVDSNFLVDKKRIEKLSKYLIKKEYEVDWFGMTEVNVCGKGLLSLMSKAGCIDLLVGVETGSKILSRKYRKLGSTHQAISFFKKINEVGINSTPSFILMQPGETKKDLKATLKIAKKIRDVSNKKTKLGTKVRFEPHLFEPLPKTALFYKIIQMGFTPPRTFKEWGELFRDLAYLKNLNIVNFTKNIKILDVTKILAEFAYLNLENYILPRSLDRVKKRHLQARMFILN